MPDSLPAVLRPLPSPSVRPWAGSRLGQGVGELWLAGPASLVDLAGGRTTLDALASIAGARLVGDRGMARLGPRFPLLVKLIDAGDWLSLQVHPSDEVARRLHGPDAVGKSEAWLVLAADPDAVLITGPRPGLAEADLRAGIAAGTLGRDDCEARAAVPGETYHLPVGTVHAIGAGAFVYEVEQPSDLTYRISDWGRPPVPGRRLHLAEALEAVVPGRAAIRCGTGWGLDGGRLVTPAFQLELLGPGGTHERAPGGHSPEVVTVVDGPAEVVGAGWLERLGPNATAVVPAACAAYRIEAGPASRVLVASLPA